MLYKVIIRRSGTVEFVRDFADCEQAWYHFKNEIVPVGQIIQLWGKEDGAIIMPEGVFYPKWQLVVERNGEDVIPYEAKIVNGRPINWNKLGALI